MRRIAIAALAAAVFGVGRAQAQDGTSAACLGQGLSVPPICFNAAQALASAYPQVGIAAAGGSPVLGTEGTRGVTLGIVPNTTGTLRLNVARVGLPDLESAAASPDERTSTVMAVKLETASRLFEGWTSGTATGIGSLELLLNAGLLPASGALTKAASTFGAGVRLGVLRESFGTPGVALSAMYRHTSRTGFGDADAASTGFAVRDVSSRLTVGKRVGPVGLLGGVGWNRFSTEGTYAYRSGLTAATADVKLHESRWSLFGDLSYALPVGALVVEGGWMSGGDAVAGYTSGSDGYDPGQGTVFGSLGLRFSL